MNLKITKGKLRSASTTCKRHVSMGGKVKIVNLPILRYATASLNTGTEELVVKKVHNVSMNIPSSVERLLKLGPVVIRSAGFTM